MSDRNNRRNRNAENAEPVADAAAAGAPAENAETPAGVETLDMDAFQSRADRANFISIKQAAQRVNGDAYEPKHDAAMRTAVNKRAEFKRAGAVLHVTVPGYEMKPLTYVAIDAVDAYNGRDKSAATGRTRGGAKRFIIRLTPDDQRAFAAGTLDTTKITLEVASQPKSKKDATPAATADASASAETPAETSTGAGNADNQPSGGEFVAEHTAETGGELIEA